MTGRRANEHPNSGGRAAENTGSTSFCITALQPGSAQEHRAWIDSCFPICQRFLLSLFKNPPKKTHKKQKRIHQSPIESNQNNWRKSQRESRGHGFLWLPLSYTCQQGSRQAFLWTAGIRDTQDTQPTKKFGTSYLFSFPLLQIVNFIFIFHLNKSESVKGTLNSHTGVNAGAGSGLKGYGDLVLEPYEKNVVRLVPQPPGGTGLHPHSISDLLWKAYSLLGSLAKENSKTVLRYLDFVNRSWNRNGRS